ncbi:cupin [Salinisphaera dokdonensis CL-ES53]|uniref:Cupin n=1 Tax=Salinisphaera dokdonensis CL-ES53 TaxID=1304272 RepID=A0ABV2B2K8_9GAMM
MQPEVMYQAAYSEFDTDERCAILEVSNHPGDPAVSIARARVAPGVTTAWHRLRNTVERYLIASGTGTVEIGDMAPAQVAPGDVALIPADTPQRIHNTGTQDLIFHAICSPRFRPDCYESLE